MGKELAVYVAAVASARLALAKVATLEQVAAIRNSAEEQRAEAKRAGLGLAAQNVFAEISIRATRRGGELLLGMRGAHGGRPTLGSPPDLGQTLASIGVNKNQSSRWRKLASIPEGVFEAHLAEARIRGETVSATKLLRVAAEFSAGPPASRRKQHRDEKPSRPTGAAPGNLPAHEIDEDLSDLKEHLQHFGVVWKTLLEQPNAQRDPAVKRRAASVLTEMRDLVENIENRLKREGQ